MVQSIPQLSSIEPWETVYEFHSVWIIIAWDTLFSKIDNKPIDRLVQRVKLNQPFLGFLDKKKKDCGKDFIEKLASGEVGVHLFDQQQSYTLGKGDQIFVIEN